MNEKQRKGEVILEVRDISKRFGKVQALDNVSLAFRKGEIHTLLGENGPRPLGQAEVPDETELRHLSPSMTQYTYPPVK